MMQIGEKYWFTSAPWSRGVLRGEVLMIESGEPVGYYPARKDGGE